ncbi:MAG TPA: LamG domain-containing protein [Chitinophagaceae bacterium]
MKKQFQILAATFITVAFISCSKGDINIPEKQQIRAEEQTAANKSGGPITIDPLSVGLEGRFEFNSNLKDQTKQLADGIASRRGGASYGFDRKGNFKSALYLDGAYSVKLKDVPQQTNTSLSVWIKPSELNAGGGIAFTNSYWGPSLAQSGPNLACVVSLIGDTPYGVIQNNQGDYFGIYNTSWHHVVIAYNGSYITVYINNVLKTSIPYTGSITQSLVEYIIGWAPIGKFWKGHVDDLRYYSRTLSAADVQKLYNQ